MRATNGFGNRLLAVVLLFALLIYPLDGNLQNMNEAQAATHTIWINKWENGQIVQDSLSIDFDNHSMIFSDGYGPAIKLNGGTLGVHNSGGAIYVGNGGVVNVYGGNVGYTSAQYGGGIYVDQGGTVNLLNCSVVGNTAQDGGGIYVADGGICRMYGGEIYENSVSGTGDGVYVSDSGKVHLLGPTYTGEIDPYDSTNLRHPNGLYLNGGANANNTLVLDGNVTGIMHIKTSDLRRDSAITTGYPTYNTDAPSTHFISDDSTCPCVVRNASGEAILSNTNADQTPPARPYPSRSLQMKREISQRRKW